MVHFCVTDGPKTWHNRSNPMAIFTIEENYSKEQETTYKGIFDLLVECRNGWNTLNTLMYIEEEVFGYHIPKTNRNLVDEQTLNV